MTSCRFVICYRHFGGIKKEITIRLEAARPRFDPQEQASLRCNGFI
jgi:hypothetical protein